MKRAMLLLTLAGCATAGTAEDFGWMIQVPSQVNRGAEFQVTVRSMRATGRVATGVEYSYQVLWPGGLQSPRGTGYSGEPLKLRAPPAAGPAMLVVICPNRKGQDIKVQEAPFDVK